MEMVGTPDDNAAIVECVRSDKKKTQSAATALICAALKVLGIIVMRDPRSSQADRIRAI